METTDCNSKCNCSICESNRYKSIAFKAGFVCESCLDYVKSHQKDDDKPKKTPSAEKL